MSKNITKASINGPSLLGAQLKAALIGLWDALRSVGITDSARSTITASATLLTTQCGYLPVNCASGNVTLTLPTSGASADEAEYRIRRIDSSVSTLTIQRGGTDTIEGATSFTIQPGQQFDLKLPAGSSTWRIVRRGGGTASQARGALQVGMPAFSAVPSAATALATNVSTKVTFGSEQYDHGGGYDAAQSRWVPGEIGIARVGASVTMATAYASVVLNVYVNGAQYRRIGDVFSGANQNACGWVDVPIASPTDYIEIYCSQSGPTQNTYTSGIDTWFMGHMVKNALS